MSHFLVSSLQEPLSRVIVEFALVQFQQGKNCPTRLWSARLRPIVMTSLAFIVGVIPLVLSTGAWASSQRETGAAVIGGILTGTLLTLFFAPLFFLLVQQGMMRLKGRKR
ncbi:Multidrug resistance protein MexB [Klebsiella pasteurii]|uniref:efflux RND transporter permease subunit n=1 Tax=Klebsiella pasteurii TaxID=2587529 RepID=UPI001170F4EA|nr:Multidrug resistance protein MexB [Klebsiella pasteurii]